MENENEIAQIRREILEVLRDSNARAKQNFAEIKQNADDARERARLAQERNEATAQDIAEVQKKNTSAMRGSLRSAMFIFGGFILLIIIQSLIRFLYG